MNIHLASQRRKKQGGFTLVEIVVATFITLLGMAGIHQLLFWIMFATTTSRQRTEASFLAQDKIEALYSAGFGQSGNGQDAVDIYERNWTVSAPANGQQELVVTISWDDIKRQRRNLSMQTFLADTSLMSGGLPFSPPVPGSP